MRRALIISALMLGTATVHAQPPSGRDQLDDEKMDATAKDLYRQAREAANHGDFTTCYAKVRAALGIQETPGTLGLRGDCALDLGRPAEAAYYLSRSRSLLPPGTAANAVAYIEERLAAAKAQIATVTIETQPPAARVFIDDSPAERVEGVAFLPPGAHTVRAEHPNHESTEQKVVATAGSEQTIDLVLKPLGTGVPEPDPNGDHLPDDGHDDSMGMTIAGAVVGGVGLLTFVGGLVPYLMAEGDKSDLTERAAATHCNGFPAPGLSPVCADLDSDFSALKTQNNVGVGLMAAGGGLAALGLVLIAIDQASGDETAQGEDGPRVHAWIGADAGAAVTIPF